MTRIIGAKKGVVTQFQGDAILASFNVPVEDHRHAENAFHAAREMLESISGRKFAGESVHIRVGIATGSLVAGNVGGGGRQSYTVYGDAVNLASRLEALNKDYGPSLLVSNSTAALLPKDALRPVGETAVRGFAAPVAVFSP